MPQPLPHRGLHSARQASIDPYTNTHTKHDTILREPLCVKHARFVQPWVPWLQGTAHLMVVVCVMSERCNGRGNYIAEWPEQSDRRAARAAVMSPPLPPIRALCLVVRRSRPISPPQWSQGRTCPACSTPHPAASATLALIARQALVPSHRPAVRNTRSLDLLPPFRPTLERTEGVCVRCCVAGLPGLSEEIRSSFRGL